VVSFDASSIRGRFAVAIGRLVVWLSSQLCCIHQFNHVMFHDGYYVSLLFLLHGNVIVIVKTKARVLFLCDEL